MNDDDEMKELFGSNDEIDIYLSYSRVSDFSKNGPRALIERQRLEGEGINVGSITDDWLFNRENFDNIYYVFNGEKPTATLGKLVNIILKNYTKLPSKEVVLNIIERNNFWKRSKEETLLANFDTPEFWSYLAAQFQGSTKTLVTTSELELGKELAEILITHEYSKDIFSDRYERINQYKFNLTYKNIKFRGVIDMVLIDHEFKTIRLVDLKTGAGPSSEFLTSFLRYRYYFQEAIYMKAIDIVKKELNIEEYQVLPFQFLYIGRSERVPITFDVTQKWHEAAINGFTSDGGYHYKGLDSTLDDIIWHFKNKEFTFSRDISENHGKIDLNDKFFSIIN